MDSEIPIHFDHKTGSNWPIIFYFSLIKPVAFKTLDEMFHKMGLV